MRALHGRRKRAGAWDVTPHRAPASNSWKEPTTPTRQVRIERFSVISAKPFAEVLAAVDAPIGHPNMAALRKAHGPKRAVKRPVEALKVARELDAKVESLLAEAQ